jgi:hypothetical protein
MFLLKSEFEKEHIFESYTLIHQSILAITQNVLQIKAEINDTLKIQEDAYAHNNELGNKIMQSTFVDL